MKVVRWAINPFNKMGIDIMSFPFGMEDKYEKYFKKYFEIDVKEQWRVKAGGILGRLYDVLGFDETLSEKKTKSKFGKLRK